TFALSELFDDIHKLFDSRRVDKIIELAVYLKGSSSHAAVGSGELRSNRVGLDTGVAEHQSIRNGLFDLIEKLGVGVGTGGEAGYAECIGMTCKHSGLRCVNNVFLLDKSSCFRNDVEQQFYMLKAELVSVTDGLSQ